MRMNIDHKFSKDVWPKNAAGMISLWALTASLVLILIAGVIIYQLLINTDDNIQVVLNNPDAKHPSFVVRYPIEPAAQKKVEASDLAASKKMVKTDEDNGSVNKPFEKSAAEVKPNTLIADEAKSTKPQRAAQKDASGEPKRSAPRDPGQSRPGLSSDRIESEEKVAPGIDRSESSETVLAPERIDSVKSQGADEKRPAAEGQEEKKQLYVNVPIGRVRQEASVDAGIVSRIYKGERIDVVASNKDWYLINTEGGRQGWAHRMLFAEEAPSPVDNIKPLIKAIRMETLTPEQGKIIIELDSYHLPETSVIKGERPRVVCDFYGLDPAPGLQKRIEVNTDIIRSIRLGIHPGAQPKTRVVIDLMPEKSYIVEQQFLIEENIYLIDIHF